MDSFARCVLQALRGPIARFQSELGRALHEMSNTSSTAVPARPARHLTLAFLALALSAAPWISSCKKEGAPQGPQPTLPSRPELLPPELLALIERYVGEVRASPKDGARHGALGLLYEANEMWPEARASFETARTLQTADPLWHLHAAIAAARVGDVPGAIEGLRAGVQQHPNFAPLQARLGDLYLLSGDSAQARTAYEAAQRLAPEAPEPLLGLADVALTENAPDKALEPLERALQLDPHYRAAHFLLGIAYDKLGRKSESALELAAGEGWQKRVLRDAGTLQLPILSFERTRARVDSGKLLAARRPREAADLLEPLAARYPDDAMLRVNLALAWRDLERTNDALRALSEAESIDPKLALAPLNRAAICLELGRAEEAEAAAARAFQIEPKLALAAVLRSQALVKLARLDEARAAAEQALALDANLAPAHEALAAAADASGHTDEARASFLRSAELAGSDPRPWPGIFHFALKSGDLELAQRALDTLRKLDAGYPKLADLESELTQAREAAQR